VSGWATAGNAFRRPGLPRLLGLLNAGRGAWAIADQGAVSLGNFLTTILLARLLPASEYGAFALLLGTMIFLNNLHGAAVVYPVLAKGAAGDEGELPKLAGDSLVMTAALAPFWLLALSGVALVLGRPLLACWAAGALVLWQLQETLRRALMARMRHRDALWGDALSYLGQVALVWLLARSGYLSLTAALAVIAATSVVAGLLQAWQVGLAEIGLARAWARAKDFLRAGRWILLGVFCSSFTSYFLAWTLGVLRGTEAVASLQAVTNLVGATHPILLSVGGIIIPAVAFANARAGVGAARRAALRHALLGAGLLFPYLAALIAFPQWVLRLVYGEASPYVSLETEARMLALTYCLTYATIIVEYFLSGLEETHLVFRGQLAGACLIVLVCTPLTAWGGLRWGLAGVAATVAARLLFNLAQAASHVRRQEPHAVVVAVPNLP
jgi:O-antigen/teichoic acid export membrane protein